MPWRVQWFLIPAPLHKANDGQASMLCGVLVYLAFSLIHLNVCQLNVSHQPVILPALYGCSRRSYCSLGQVELT